MKNKIRDFLWSISGHQKEIMLQTKIDGFRAVIIGSMLVMVGIYATLAWTFFFSTVTHNVFLSLTCGFFAGTFIVFFDRAIISTLSSGKRNLWALGFRFLLAILLGAFLAQPIILKVYERDIKREAVILIDLKRQERKAELDKLYASEVSSLLKRRDELKALVDKQNQQMTENARAFMQEMDGTGGTGLRGYHTISQKKEGIYKSDVDEYNRIKKETEPENNRITARLDSIQQSINSQLAEFDRTTHDQGFLIQSEALKSLIAKDKSNTLRDRYWLLVVILMLIELSALLAKLIIETKSYGAKVDLQIEKEVSRTQTDRDIYLAKLEAYNKHLLQRETSIIEDFFTRTDPTKDLKLDEISEEWKKSSTQTYKDTWDAFKKRLIIHDGEDI